MITLVNNIYINLSHRSCLTIYRANDFPFGHFGLASPSIFATVGDGGTISRVINFTVNREGGAYGSVSVKVITTYNPVSPYHQTTK